MASLIRSVSLRFSAYLCVLCVYGCFNAEVAEVRREPQRKTESKTLLNTEQIFCAFVPWWCIVPTQFADSEKEFLPLMYLERSGSFMAAVVLAVALVVATVIGGWFFVKGKRGDQTITVTGSARKRIKSDLVIWRSAVSYQAPVLSEAYRALSESVPRVKAYLVSKGIPENQITISSISSQTLHGRTTDGAESSEITGK